jgi:hypothetical protein
MASPPRVFAAIAAIIWLTGCSVGMALSGDNDPDIGAVRIGSTRGEAEMHLGSPVRTNAGAGGSRIDIYEYEIGNEPSGGRAVAHGVMDVLTLGLWEIAGTPIEAVQGEKYEATLTYRQWDAWREPRLERFGRFAVSSSSRRSSAFTLQLLRCRVDDAAPSGGLELLHNVKRVSVLMGHSSPWSR